MPSQAGIVSPPGGGGAGGGATDAQNRTTGDYSLLADALANPSTNIYGALNLGWNGTTWDRLKSTTANGLVVDVSRIQGTVTADVSDRAGRLLGIVDTELPAATALADAAANPTTPAIGSFTLGFNGTTWDRLRSTTANGLAVDVTRVTGTVTVDTELPAAAALTDAFANPTTPNIASMLMGWNGTTWDRLKSTTAQGLVVDVSRVQGTVSVPGPYTEDAASVADPIGYMILGRRRDVPLITEVSAESDVIALNANSRGQLYVAGIDHDAVNLLETVQIGGHAANPDAPPAVVSAAGDRVHAWYDKYGVAIMRQRKVRETYIASYRLAETAARMNLSWTAVANTTKQLATLHHAATSLMELQIFRVSIWVTGSSVAGQGLFEIRKINTAPATGNPAITPGAYKDNATATEAIALALPTTAGTEVNVNVPYGMVIWDLGIGAAGSDYTAIPAKFPPRIDLYNFDEASDSAAPLTLRAGQLQGIAVVGRHTSTSTLSFAIEIIYAEETI